MYIALVAPLSRNVVLSYFTAQKINPGDIVVVPFLKKDVVGIVTGVREALPDKTSLKKSPFGFRKIKSVVSGDFFTPAFIAACTMSARYYATEPGIIIKSVSSPTILAAVARGKKFSPYVSRSTKKTTVTPHALQIPEKDRFAAYKGIVREEFARGRSVLFLAPTAFAGSYAASLLERGIEDYVYFFHEGLPEQKILSLWEKIRQEKHPVLIIGQKTCASLPREDIGAIIVEDEASWLYKDERAPFIDMRIFARYLAEALGARYIRGGLVLSLETLYAREQKNVEDLAQPQFRLLSSANSTIVDMRPTHSPLQLTPHTFTIISDELKQIIEEARAEHEHVFLFAARRGLYPLTLCSDCGFIITCKKCSSPLVLHKSETKRSREAQTPVITEAERVFLCHACNTTNVIKDRCPSCDSWRLSSFGIGTARIEEEVIKLFPGARVFRVDADSTPSQKKAEKRMTQFLETPGGILVGTELALNMLKKKIAVTAAVSIDPLFAVPSFRMHEKVFHLLLLLRERANKAFILETRMPERTVFKHALGGNSADFYKEEKKNRELFLYPPFTTLIKLTTKGGRERVAEDVVLIKKTFADYSVSTFPAFVSKARGKYIAHAAIKIAPLEWPDEKLEALLSSLPSSIAINIEPEHLL